MLGRVRCDAQRDDNPSRQRGVVCAELDQIRSRQVLRACRVVFVEAVLNPRLEQFLLHRGYVPCGVAEGSDNFYLPR